MSAESTSRPARSSRDLLPSMSELRLAARSMLAGRDQGPLHRLGIAVADTANIELLPQARRARDFHLHDHAGKRWLDLFRGEGFSLLGYSMAGFRLGIKNRIAQSLWQGLPHPLYKQVKRRLERCFPNHTALISPDRYRIQSMLELLGVKADRPLLPLISDLTDPTPRDSLGWWVPFTGAPGPFSVALIPSLGIAGPYVLLVDSHRFAHQLTSFGTHEHEVFTILDYIGHAVPVYALDALISALDALESLGAMAGTGALSQSGSRQTLGALNHPRTRQLQGQLGLWRESAWQETALGAWKRVGPWLYHSFSPDEYRVVFAAAAKAGILLNPRSNGLNCLPGVMSDGERKALEAVLALDPRLPRTGKEG